jgi:hypothetical protein
VSDLVTDHTDPRLGHGGDDKAVKQNAAYLVLSDEELKKGFVRPVRMAYEHLVCGTATRMSTKIAETYARDPWFYGSTYCVGCSMHRPLREFKWEGAGAESMDPRLWPESVMNEVLGIRAKETK